LIADMNSKFANFFIRGNEKVSGFSLERARGQFTLDRPQGEREGVTPQNFFWECHYTPLPQNFLK